MATIAVPAPAGGLTLYRLLEHAEPSARDFEPHLSRSQARLQRVPELFRVSVSHWLEIEQAIGASKRGTCFIARLALSADAAVDALLRVALTEQRNPGHVDVWGHPADMLRCLVKRCERSTSCAGSGFTWRGIEAGATGHARCLPTTGRRAAARRGRSRAR